MIILVILNIKMNKYINIVNNIITNMLVSLKYVFIITTRNIIFSIKIITNKIYYLFIKLYRYDKFGL